MKRDGYLYEAQMAAPVRFRAHGLDAADRALRRATEAFTAALTADPEVLLVEDKLIARPAVMPCDGTLRCRAPLHRHGCPKR